jgi:predicted DNA-binding antitoxin AbrB/MazE fold protein
MQSIHATFVAGVFRPLGPMSLPEGSEVELHVVSTTQPQANGSTSAPMSIEDRIAQIAAEVPQEAWDSLPADLSDNLDHYIYGTERE